VYQGGEQFLIEDYFCCRKDAWIIVVGYPLQRDFSINEFEAVIDKIIERLHPIYASLIAPELPLSLVGSRRERDSDHYYTLDIHDTIIDKGGHPILSLTLKGLSPYTPLTKKSFFQSLCQASGSLRGS
jgi:hypothetical protein